MAGIAQLAICPKTSAMISYKDWPDSFSKKYRWIIFLLVIFDFTTCAAGAYFLYKVDKDYALLIQDGVPLLNDMQTATWQSSRIHTFILAMTDAESAADQASLDGKIREAAGVNRQIFAWAGSRRFLSPDLRDHWLRVVADREQWRSAGREVLQLAKAGRLTEARAMIFTTADTAYETYQREVDSFCDHYMEVNLSNHSLILRRAKHRRILLYAFAALPVGFLLTVLGYYLVSLGLWMFRVLR